VPGQDVVKSKWVADRANHVRRISQKGTPCGELFEQAGPVFECTGIDPRARGRMVDDLGKIVGVTIHNQDVGDFAQIFVGELVGTRRAKSREKGRLGCRACACAENQELPVCVQGTSFVG
jgi:hypothetical protein